MARYINVEKADIETIHVSYMGYSSKADIADWLRKQPTADVAEVRHGEWIWDTEDKYKCSRCHYTTRVDEVMGLPQYNYCPNCGAKLKGSTE